MKNRRVSKEIEKTVRNFLYKSYNEDDISAYAAQIAYFMIMSAIPFIILLASLLKYTFITEDDILYFIEEFAPDYISSFLVNAIDKVYNQSVGVISITGFIAVWASAKGIHCMVNALNKINNLRETRNWFLIRFRAMAFTLLFLVVIVALMIFMVFGSSVSLIAQSHFAPIYLKIFNFIMDHKFVTMFVLLVVFFVFVFRFLPNRPQNATIFYQLPGAFGAAIAWYVFTIFLTIAVRYMNAFSWYGNMASLLIIMTWLYICLTIMLICAEVNVIFEVEFRVLFTKLKEQNRFKIKNNVFTKKKASSNKLRMKRNYKNVKAQYQEQSEEKNRAIEVSRMHSEQEVKRFSSGFTIIRDEDAHYIKDDSDDSVLDIEEDIFKEESK